MVRVVLCCVHIHIYQYCVYVSVFSFFISFLSSIYLFILLLFPVSLCVSFVCWDAWRAMGNGNDSAFRSKNATSRALERNDPISTTAPYHGAQIRAIVIGCSCSYVVREGEKVLDEPRQNLFSDYTNNGIKE